MSMVRPENIPNVAPGSAPCERPQWQELIDGFLALTHSMLVSAEKQEWDAVMELEVQRRGIIFRIFDVPPSAWEAAPLAACLQQVLALDRHIIERGEAGLRELSGELAGFEHGRRARNAYQEATSG